MGKIPKVIFKRRKMTMKTMTRIAAVALVAVMMCMMLASCNTISGTYSATYESEGIFGFGAGKYTTTYEFKGKNVTRTDDVTVGSKTTTNTVTGTYVIEDDTIVITWDKDVETGDGQSSTTKSTFSFAKGDGFVLIDGRQYDKK